MSNIVPFRPERSSRSERSVRTEGAAILFFTGVRYVRSEDEDAAADILPLGALESRPGENCPAGDRVERLQA